MRCPICGRELQPSWSYDHLTEEHSWTIEEAERWGDERYCEEYGITPTPLEGKR